MYVGNDDVGPSTHSPKQQQIRVDFSRQPGLIRSMGGTLTSFECQFDNRVGLRVFYNWNSLVGKKTGFCDDWSHYEGVMEGFFRYGDGSIRFGNYEVDHIYLKFDSKEDICL